MWTAVGSILDEVTTVSMAIRHGGEAVGSLDIYDQSNYYLINNLQISPAARGKVNWD